MAKKDQEKFITKGERIVKRYRDERSEIDETQPAKRYNILWSNIQTLFPAVYAKKPQAQVERRYKDADPIARTASQILERALQYEIDHYPDYDAALRGCVLDRLLPGRGVAWIRFEDGDEGPEVTDDVGKPKLECAPTDYVFWKDFRFSPARTWEEVTWVARRVYMTEEEGKARFGDVWVNIPLKHEPIGLQEAQTSAEAGDMERMKKAVIWEIWDKPSRTVIWKAEGVSDPLDERPDFLRLQRFFPCPKPLFATLTSDTLNPIADYLEYQDQAIELDDLTARIALLVKAVKVVGVYDSSQTGVQRMLQEGTENTLIPVDTWAAFSEKGGLKGVVDWMPLDQVIQALNELYLARDATKQVIYDITGLSDIIRGSSDPRETATAQRIKGNYGGLRLKATQGDIARFATDLLNMKAEVICEFYRPETLEKMSGIALTEDAQYAEQAIQLLKSEDMRNYRIEIATDSMVELDEQAEKESRVEFLTAAGGFLEKGVAAVQVTPELGPLIGEMLMFGVRAFKAGRPIEAAFEQAVKKLNEPRPQKPDPEQLKIDAKTAADQAKLQADQQADAARAAQEERAHARELQQSAELEKFKASLADQQAQRDAARDERIALRDADIQRAAEERDAAREAAEAARSDAFERWKVELVEANKLTMAQMAQASSEATAAISAAAKPGESEKPAKSEKPDTSMADAIADLKAAFTEMASMPREIVRDPDGRATGVKIGGVVKKINRGADGRVTGV